MDWRTYRRLLRIFDERPGWRLTYDRGELEIASPTAALDNDGRFLGRLVVTLTEELDLPLINGGSVTMRRRSKRCGIEADDCFWIASAARMAGRRQLDLRIDPPPDLAIEAEMTRSSLDRMRIYQRLRLPEVWRLERDVLTFYRLNAAGVYDVVPLSMAFPWIKPADLVSFVRQGRQAADQNAVVRDCREWIRQRRPAPPPRAD